MATPRAFIGSATDGRIMLLGEGHQDAGQDIDTRLTTNPFAPAGAAMDCSFDRVYVTVTHSARVRLRCTPIVDDEYQTGAAFDIELAQPTSRRSQVVERQLYQRSTRHSVFPYMEGLRGRWFQLEIDSADGLFPGDLIFDQIALEFDPLSPTQREG